MSSPTPQQPARVSLRDVAKAVGVSHVTVSLALRGDPRISASRQKEVIAAATKLGYRPDPMLSSLSAYRHAKRPVTIHSTVAWINQWENPKALHRLREFEAYWRGAREAAETLGYRLEEFVLGRDMSGQRLLKIFQARNVRGILIPPHSQGLTLPDFDWSLFSTVRLGISVKHPRVHVITSDQINCATLAYDQVLAKGYCRVGYVSSRRFDRNTGGNFRAGYLTSQDVHMPVRHHLAPMIMEEDSAAADAQRLRVWLKRTRPDAIITTLDTLPSLLAQAGWSVPKNVAVAALSILDGNFDSGVDQNSHEVGLVAMRTLAGLIHQNERGIPQYCRRILVEGRWINGTSLPQNSAAADTYKRVRVARTKSVRTSARLPRA